MRISAIYYTIYVPLLFKIYDRIITLQFEVALSGYKHKYILLFGINLHGFKN